MPESILAITGQPALADIGPNDNGETDSFGKTTAEQPKIAFISEPYHKVMGADMLIDGHCGFTEYGVLKQLADQLTKTAPETYVYILPHPKHEDGEMEALWNDIRDPLQGEVVRLGRTNNIFSVVGGVAGMTSILLYESWLYGLPTLALQPDCRMDGTKRFARLEGIFYSSDHNTAGAVIDKWHSAARNEQRFPRKEAEQHKHAAQSVTDILCKLAQ